jgi:hypothetical protein
MSSILGTQEGVPLRLSRDALAMMKLTGRWQELWGDPLARCVPSE